jgi:hypothetical protein
MNRTHFRWLAAGLAVLLAGQPAAAQLKIAYDKDGDKNDLQRIALRPNVEQKIYLFYANTVLGGARTNVQVTLQQVTAVGAKEVVKEIAKTIIPKVDAKKTVPVSFPLPAPKDPAAPWPKLDGPPFALRFLLLDGTTKNPVQFDVPIRIQEPRETVKVRNANYNPNTRELTFKLGTKELFDPPCPVELVLHPSAIPGLIPNMAGTFKQTLSKESQEVELSASNVMFEGGVPPQNGRVSITVDGFERAFLFKCAFAQGLLTPLSDATRVRLVAPRFALPAPKLPVTIEIDSKSQEQSDEDALQTTRVEVRFDRAGGGTYQEVVGSPFFGLREQTVEYKADGEALVFKTKVKDRVIELNTDAINGKRQLQVRLFNSKRLGVTIANEQDITEEKVALFSQGPENKFAPLTFDRTNNAVTAELILDATAAEDLRIVGLPARAKPEERLKPRLTFKSRTTVQAPAEKIAFFFGEAGPDHKLPEKANKFDAVLDKDGAYVPKDEMLVPADKLGKLFVSAQVETATGKLMTAKQSLTIATKTDNGGANVLTTITGVLKRGELAQPEVVVVLSKAKPEKDDVPKQAKTKSDGKFEFVDIEPGRYVLAAKRLDTRAVLPITVEKNQEKMSVELKLLAK